MQVFKLILLSFVTTAIVLVEGFELNLNFHQNDYELEFRRLELVYYNKKYMKDMSVVTYKYNRSQPVANITYTFKVDVGYDLEWILQAYTFLSNEYRIFPIHFQANYCKSIAANVAGIRQLTKCGNFTGCPVLKDNPTLMCHFYPDPSHFPPLIPNGDYKVEIQAMYLSEEVYVLNLYAVITRPVPFGRK